MNLTIGNDVALAFGLLFARAGGVMSALPTLLGVSMPVQIRLMLAALIAAALIPLASITVPAAPGVAPIVLLVIREIAIGLTLSFAASIVVGAVMTAGSVIGGSMEMNSGAVLRGHIESPNALSDGFGALAALLFFVGGFHRMLILALAKSLLVAPLGTLSMPDPHHLLGLGGRMFALALALAFPVMVPAIRALDRSRRNRKVSTAGEHPDRRAGRDPDGGPGTARTRLGRTRRGNHPGLDQCYDPIDGMAQWLIVIKRPFQLYRKSGSAPVSRDRSPARVI